MSWDEASNRDNRTFILMRRERGMERVGAEGRQVWEETRFGGPDMRENIPDVAAAVDELKT